MSDRVINFNAGPAGLPLAALEEAQRELLDFRGSGMSVMELSHRSPEYDAVHNETKSLVRELLGVSEDYHVLFLQGGASQQFAMVPMNLRPSGSADYVLTGSWSKKALKEAQILGEARVAASTEEERFRRIPREDELKLDPQAAYVHVTSNNTIFGTQWHDWPDTRGLSIVADMSSDILSRRLPIERFGLIYAGAQKNLGPSGVTLVIIHDDLVARAPEDLSTMLSYRTHAAKDSLFNTPPTFGVYLMGRVLAWLKAQGGLEGVEGHNRDKAATLYRAIDESEGYYRSTVDEDSRSLMNVTFRLPDEDREKLFIAEAKQARLVGLKGHRSVGGCRASIYNAMTQEGIDRLVEFMGAFRKANP
jgi:phosphoserine aminotransferase